MKFSAGEYLLQLAGHDTVAAMQDGYIADR